MTLAEAQSLFSNDSFATEAAGVEILEVGHHFSRCGLSVRSVHRNAMGAVMGGVLFTLADFAFAVAANSEELSWVSLESSIHFVSAAPSQRLVATTRCLHHGRRSCLYEIEIHNEEERLLAVVTTSGLNAK